MRRPRRALAAALALAVVALASPLVPARGAGPVGSWRATGDMGQARSLHRAVVLANGDVFVVGGGAANPGQGEVYHAGGGAGATAGTWTAVGNGTNRYYATATLLGSGRVLVAGGRSAQSGAQSDITPALDSAELYDPASPAVTTTAKLNAGRFEHTATLLANGTVLVTGGLPVYSAFAPAPALASAEIYDPQNPAWSEALPMANPRWGHTATALGDGRVVVIGGKADAYDLTEQASVEIFDPEATVPGRDQRGAWSPAAPMATVRTDHTATLLDGPACHSGGTPPAYCGKVLVTGVSQTDGAPAAEIFDPGAPGSVGSWSPTTPMHQARSRHRATALGDGRVLVVGGSADGSAEIYDPAAGTWVLAASPSAARSDFSLSLLDAPSCHGPSAPGFCGQALLAGGHVNGDLRSAELFGMPKAPPQVLGLVPPAGPATGGTRVAITTSALTHVTGVRFGGVAAAEWRVESPTAIAAVSPAHPPGAVAVEVDADEGTATPAPGVGFSYFATTGTWEPAGEPTSPRAGASATLLGDGTVLVVGGTDSHFAASAEIFHPATRSWGPASSPKVARVHHSATRLGDGRVLVVGGGSEYDTSAEIYDPAGDGGAGSWTTAAPLAVARKRPRATLLANGKVLVSGGGPATCAPQLVDTQCRSTAELFDPAGGGGAGSWSPAGQMTTVRFDHTATLLDGPACHSGGTPPAYCGKVLVAGGGINNGNNGGRAATARAELYDPTAGPEGRWEAVGSMARARIAATATALGDGRVLVAGGDGTGTAETFRPDQDQAHQWVPAGTMASERAQDFAAGFTATLLDGPGCHPVGASPPAYCAKVVVVGGQASVSGPSLATAELFDPETLTWERAASLAVARADHAAVALADGTVVVVGGRGGLGQETAVRLAEVFDPAATGARAPTVASVEPGVGPTRGGTPVRIRGAGFFGAAAVSFAGRVVQPSFVADDEVSAVSPASARQGPAAVTVTRPGAGAGAAGRFVYGPGAWRATEALGTARAWPTGTALGDGRVLVAGGTTGNSSTATASAEIYDPAADDGRGAWATAKPMLAGRFDHTATLLDGPACHAPGAVAPCGSVLVAGGASAGDAAYVTSAELYDPRTGEWIATRPMNIRRTFHTATLLDDGRVLVAGGIAAGGQTLAHPTASAEIYDPAHDTWTPTAPLHQARLLHSATLLSNGTVLVVGGLDTDPAGGAEAAAAVQSAELFDPRANHGAGGWTSTTALAVARYGHTATLLGDGSVLVAGGQDGGGPLASSERYDPAARAWGAGQMLVERAFHTATLLGDGTVLVSGRADNRELRAGVASIAEAEVYDPATKAWSPTTAMSTRRGGHSATVLGGPACGRAGPPPYCGAVLMAGGALSEPDGAQLPLAGAEVYQPAAHVGGVSPRAGVAGEAGEVVVSGSGFAGATKVYFGDQDHPAAGMRVESPTRIVATHPPGAAGRVEVAVEGPGGISARTTPQPQAAFTPYATPAAVTALVARATSPSTVELSFVAPDDGSGDATATEFVITQDGVALCGGRCAPDPTRAFAVTDLSASKTYRYSVAARNEVGLVGPAAAVEVTTPALGATCTQATPAPGQVALSGGRYHLIGAPPGTAVGSDSPLYGWFDQGGGGSYSLAAAPEAGRGYWSFSFCDRAISLAGAGPTSMRLPLGAYHASMVGNPSGAPATVSGADFSARWDPDSNAGSGGYVMSTYRGATPLAPGQGAWAFSYRATEVRIDSG